MKNATQTRVLAIVLALATVAACVLAALNFEHENGLDVPTDGVWWVEANGGLRAERVPVDPRGTRAGIRTGDILLSVNDQPTPRVASLGREMFHSGIWAHATYSILRPVPQSVDLNGATRLDIQVILEPKDRSFNQYLRFIALVYLCIGIYVLFRRWTAPKSIHFYVFCLASFVLYSFRSTGELGWFDWGNIVAQALQPALFLHFAVSFSDNYASDERNRFGRRLVYALLYVPGLFLLGLQYTAIRYWSATEILLHRLDQISLGYLALYYVIAAIVFRLRYRSAESGAGTPATQVADARHAACGDSVHAAQRNSLSCGLADARLPDEAGGALACDPSPDVQLGHCALPADGRGSDLQAWRDLHAGDGLACRPLLRHHRGHGGDWCIHGSQSLGIWGLMVGIVVTGIVFEPLKRAIQARVDRVFDQKRFDYRETLVEFGRGINSQTDLVRCSTRSSSGCPRLCL